jgi:LPXTG-motif cell wall-anchored protein
VVETEAAGEVTVPSVLNVVEVVSDTDDNNPDNNKDDEETSIIEILDVVILPFTGVDSDYLFVIGLGLALGGSLMIWVTRRREEEGGLDH